MQRIFSLAVIGVAVVRSATAFVPSTKFTVHGLVEPLQELEDAPVAVVSCVGAHCTGKSTLTRTMFGAEVERETVLPDINLAILEVDCGCLHDGKVVVDLAGSTVALAASDVVIYNIFMQDLSRSASSLSEDLQPSLEKFLQLCDSGVVDSSKKRAMIVVVRDFDGDDASKDDVAATITKCIDKMWAQAVKPEGMRSSSFQDFFSISFSYLPNKMLSSQDYSSEAARLRESVMSSISDRAPASEVARTLSAVVSHSRGASGAASQKEMDSAYTAKAAAAQCLATCRARIEALSSVLQELDEEFGERVDKIVSDVLEEFDTLTAGAPASGVISKKRSELKAALVREFHGKYEHQLQRLRAAALDKYTRSLSQLRVSPTLSRDINGVMKEAGAYFQDTVKGLHSKYGGWQYESVWKDLREDMRQIGADRLQLAKLQGSYIPGKSRRPVNVGVHWLLPQPFGTDARQSIMAKHDEVTFSNLSSTPMIMQIMPMTKIPAPPGGEVVEHSKKLTDLKRRAKKMIHVKSPQNER